jgi:DNA-binding transcriptional MerR regulator
VTIARTYRIGEVHRLLRDEFPDLELSKIRYYEDQGLVQPKRTKSKYRVFAPSDVEGLREALRLRARNIALPDVRRRLVDRGMIAPEGVPSNGPAARAARLVQANAVTARIPEPAATVSTPSNVSAQAETQPLLSVVPADTYSTAEFVAACGLKERQVNDLQAQGFLAPEIMNERLTYSSIDLVVAQRAAVLLAQGVAVRQLTPLRRIVQLELDFVRDLTVPLHSLPKAQRALQAARVASEVSALRNAIYSATVAKPL